MKSIAFLFLLLSVSSFAQNAAPADYVSKSFVVEDSKDVFINLGAAVSSMIDQTGWDIALYNESHEIGGKVNEQAGVRVWRVYQDTNNFSSVTMNDTLYPAYNSDNYMYIGALDTLYTGNTTNYFTIGLGRFFFGTSYTVRGDRIYIIRKSDGSFGKFYLKSYSSTNRTFVIQYANIDNSGSGAIEVLKSTPTGATKHYQYLNLTTKAISSAFETVSYDDWDIVLRKYFSGSPRTSSPLGVFTNNVYNLIRISKELGTFSEGLPDLYLRNGYVSTEAYQVSGNTLTTAYDGSLWSFNPISRIYNQIGINWYNSTTTMPKQDVSYFLRDKNGKVWHLIFKNYSLSSKTVEIAYKQVATHNSFISSFSEKTNPFNLICQNGKFVVENNENKLCDIEIMDVSGRVLRKSSFSTIFVIDDLNASEGLVLIKVSNDKHQRIFKVHY